MSARGEGVTVLRWRWSRTTGMHYYEDNKNGYGYVQNGVEPGRYIAVGYGWSGIFQSLKAAKAFVEESGKKKGAKARSMPTKPCKPWCGQRCPFIGSARCYHSERYPLRFCRARCRDNWTAAGSGKFNFASSAEASKASADLKKSIKPVTVEVLRCNHCPRLAVSLDGERVTSHKCRGQWTAVLTEKTTTIRPAWRRP